MTDFKVGDKVEFIEDYPAGPAKTGDRATVLRVDDLKDGLNAIVHFEEGIEGACAYRLKLVKPEPKFAVGDWVKVHGRHDKWDGTVGTVHKMLTRSFGRHGNLYIIHKDDKTVGEDVVLQFFEDQLAATEAPKPVLKEGDWAKAVGYGQAGGSFEGRVGEVVGVHHTTIGALITLKYPFVAGKAAQGTFDSKYIQAAEAPKPEFKVGDEVEFLKFWTGTTGTVIAVDDEIWPIRVKKANGGVTGRFTADELELVKPAPKFAKGGLLPKQEFGPINLYAEFDAKLTAKVLGQFEDKPAPLKIYLAGPMSGIEHYNFPAFFTAARKLRAAGHTVFNPAENDLATGFNALGMEGHEASDHGFSLREALKTDLSWICENADALVLLEGWEGSKGVRAEMALAEALGLPKYEMERLPAEVAK